MNKKTSSGSFLRSEKSANNSDVLESTSKNQVNLHASQIRPCNPPVNVEAPQPKHVIHNKNKREEEINTLKLEAQLSILS